MSKPKTVDEYLAALSADQRAALEKLRTSIKAATPTAEEYLGYGLAAFRLDGKPLVAMGATAKHCGFYLMSSSTVETHADALQNYDTSKGTIRFAADKPIPVALVRKLVKARIAENAELSGKTKTPATTKTRAAKGQISVQDAVQTALEWLEQKSTEHDRQNLTRFAIGATKAYGVSMANMKQLAKRLGRNDELAAALWETGWYEARMLASLIDDPACVTAAQMDRWCRDFDNWAICDTACFALFDRTPHAWKKVEQWSRRNDEFIKRAAFALLWGLTVHDKEADDAPFLKALSLVERAADDERNFVKKAVNMALRAVGKRSRALNQAAVEVARRLADSEKPAPRWVGKDALRELTSPAVTRRLKARG